MTGNFTITLSNSGACSNQGTSQKAYFSLFQIRTERLSIDSNIRLYLGVLVILSCLGGCFNKLRKEVRLRNRV